MRKPSNQRINNRGSSILFDRNKYWGISRVLVKATHERMTMCRPLQEIIDNRINIRVIVRHSVPIIYAQLDVDIDTAQATCNTCRSINNTATGAIDASLIHRKGYRPSALNVSRYSLLSYANKRLNDKLHLFHVLCRSRQIGGVCGEEHYNGIVIKDLHLMRNIHRSEEGYNSSRETLRTILCGISYSESAKKIPARYPYMKI